MSEPVSHARLRDFRQDHASPRSFQGASIEAWRCQQTHALTRITLGLVYLAHGPWLKAVVFGMPNVSAYFETLGLPGVLAYAVLAAETVGGLMLVLGIFPALVALALLPILIGAIAFDHGNNGWLFAMEGGGWEYPAVLIVLSVTIALSRGGSYALRP